MEKKLFADLVTSLKEAAVLSKGKAHPAQSRDGRIERRQADARSAHGIS